MRFTQLFASSLLLSCSCLVAQSQQPETSKPPTSEPQAASAVPADSQALVPIKSDPPAYPLAALQKGIDGQVWLRIVVSKMGEVKAATAISGDPILVPAALDAVKKWQFQPFLKGGKPVEIAARMAMDFSLPAKSSTEGGNSGNSRPKRVRVSYEVISGLLINKVAPKYPDDAKRAHLTGSVILKGVISRDGAMKQLTIVSGHPMLIDSALKAVSQWRCKPYLLNGEPVEVETTITVNFEMRP